VSAGGVVTGIANATGTPYFTAGAWAIGNAVDKNGNQYVTSTVAGAGTVATSTAPSVGNFPYWANGTNGLNGTSSLSIATTTGNLTAASSVFIGNSLNVTSTLTVAATTTLKGNVSTTIANSLLATDGNGLLIATSSVAGANPTQLIDGATHNGSAGTFMRSDAIPGFATAVTATGTSFTVGTIAEPMYDNGTTTTAQTTIDWSRSNKQMVAIATGTTKFMFTNATSGGSYSLWIMQDGSGSRLATWQATGTAYISWSSNATTTLSTGANAMDMASFQCFTPHATTTFACYSPGLNKGWTQ